MIPDVSSSRRARESPATRGTARSATPGALSEYQCPPSKRPIGRELPVRVDVHMPAQDDRLRHRQAARVLSADDAHERQGPERDEHEDEPLEPVAREAHLVATARSQSKLYSKLSGNSASALASPAAYSSAGMRSKVEKAFARITSRAFSRLCSRRWLKLFDPHGRHAGGGELLAERVGIREPGPVDRRHRREVAREPDPVEACGILGCDREPALRPEHARGLGEGPGAVGEMKNHPHHDGVEPARLERQRLGTCDPGVHAERLGALDHRRGGVERPDACALALLEGLREPAGAAADFEDALAAQLPEPHERVEDLPPVGVDRAQLLVARGAPVECARSPSRGRGLLACAVGMRASLDEDRLAPFREGQLDDVEVARQDGVREHLAGLAEQLGAEIPGRDVREREQPDARRERDLGGLVSGRVAGVGGAIASLPGRTSPRGSGDRLPGTARRRPRRGVCPRCRRQSVRVGAHRRGPRAAPSCRRQAPRPRRAGGRLVRGRTGRRARRPSCRRSDPAVLPRRARTRLQGHRGRRETRRSRIRRGRPVSPARTSTSSTR